VRQSFFYARHFLNDADLNVQALSWMGQTANVRIHRTTGEVPRTRFDRDERVLLRPLPARRHRSLILAAPQVPSTQGNEAPLLAVERRSLAGMTAWPELADECRCA
jgi:hypothetical protein